jgi:hypothetical protein
MYKHAKRNLEHTGFIKNSAFGTRNGEKNRHACVYSHHYTLHLREALVGTQGKTDRKKAAQEQVRLCEDK